jgi:hypothetical protein
MWDGLGNPLFPAYVHYDVDLEYCDMAFPA